MTANEAIYKMLLQVLKNQVAMIAWMGLEEDNRDDMRPLIMLILETEALVEEVEAR